MKSLHRALLPVAITAAAGLTLGLTSCSATSDNAAGGDLTPIAYQLPWLPNVESAETFIALENGYFTDEGLDVTLLDGGPTVSGSAVVASGNALIGVSGLDEVASAVSQGADLTVVGFQYQKSPYGLGSMSSDPIDNPGDLAGKVIGVPAANLVAWNAFLQLNAIDPSSITVVPITDGTPLLDGTIQGQTIYATFDPTQKSLLDAGFRYFLYDDFGYHMATSVYVVQSSSLDDPDKRAAIEGFLRAEIKGWNDSLADPELGAHLAVDEYGKDLGLDLDQQILQSKAQNALVSNDWTDQHGLLTISDELLDESIDTLRLSGIDADESLVDLSLVHEIGNGQG